MLTRLILAVENRELQVSLEQSLAPSEIQIDCHGHMKNPWLNVVQSCGDIIVISESLIPRPVESSISQLNSLPEAPTTVVIHDFDSSEEHARLMAAGADVVLYSRVTLNNLIDTIQATVESRLQLVELNHLARKKGVQPKLTDFSTNSETMQFFINEVQLVAPSDSTILLLGETGVGKEHLAKAIHYESPRSSGPFIALNAAALPEQLLESELFGHTRGAFTGATRARRGAFELAHGGTIFLDEIGEMPLHLQTKLLRVLQDYEVRPLGGEKQIWVDVRVITATNRDLEKDVELGNFRKDLYFRLNVMSLIIPPLRDRREDVPSLARRFLSLYKYKIAKDVNQISKPAMAALSNYEWPGNVRELMNVIERAILLCKTNQITLDDLPSVFNSTSKELSPLMASIAGNVSFWEGKSLPEIQKIVMEEVEGAYLRLVLTKTRGRVGQAAKIAGIHSRGLYSKMKHLGIHKEDFK
jgi:two-component system, NtrC family, response regulator AtoC